MAVTNLDKFKEIEGMMEEAQSLMPPYLAQLEQRYDYMNDLRREFSHIKHTLGRIEQYLDKQEDNELDVDSHVRTVAKQAIERIESLIEDAEMEQGYEDTQISIPHLKKAKNALEDNIDEDSIETAWRMLKIQRIHVEEIDVLMDLVDAMDEDNTGETEVIYRMIGQLRSEYLSSFVTYRKACQEDESLYYDMERLVSVLEDNGLNDYAQELGDAMPDITEQRGQRPDPQPLLDLLTPIKSAGLEYFPSKNKNSESYDLNVMFARELAYARRSLLEDREFIGTRNAFDRLNHAFQSLSTYMYDRFHQLGGTPYNYHGHEDRIR